MKKYIKSSHWLEFTEADRNELLDKYMNMFEKQGFEVEALRNDARYIVLGVVSVNKDQGMVYNNQPCAGGYAMHTQLFFSQDLKYMTEDKLSDKNLVEDVMRYIDDWMEAYDDLVNITVEIEKIKPQLPSIAAEFKSKYSNKFPDLELHAEIGVWSTGNINGKYKYPLLYGGIRENPAIKFSGIAAGEKFSEKYVWDNWISGQGEDDLVKTIARIYRSKKRQSTSKNNELISILQEHNIDITKSKYELIAEAYERFGSGGHYKKSFTCPGDYLAYFAMAVHTTPNYKNLIENYFGDIYEFEEFVESNPTVDDIADIASSSWWGDGDDYIVSLTNTSTGDVLYSGGESDYAEYEEDWED